MPWPRSAASAHRRQESQSFVNAWLPLDDSVNGIKYRQIDGADVIMPRLSGGELYEPVRETDRRTPFLFTTGYAASEIE